MTNATAPTEHELGYQLAEILADHQDEQEQQPAWASVFDTLILARTLTGDPPTTPPAKPTWLWDGVPYYGPDGHELTGTPDEIRAEADRLMLDRAGGNFTIRHCQGVEIHVSTMFFPQSFPLSEPGTARPILWETMVFYRHRRSDDPRRAVTGHQWRYATIRAAQQGHARVVATLDVQLRRRRAQPRRRPPTVDWRSDRVRVTRLSYTRRR
jgi:hypothetical protein